MITLLNAAPDTGNQGVSALCHSIVAGLKQRGAESITVADHGRGTRRQDWGHSPVNLVGLTNHRRIWRGDCLLTAYSLARFGGLFSGASRTIAGSKAVLDISGGDSFTDIYGQKRFRAMVLSKRMALSANVPLILLPQKIGPFRSKRCEHEAIEILKKADAVWVRDKSSYQFLQSSLGEHFAHSKHRLGVDVAVTLPAVAPKELDPICCEFISSLRQFPVAGLNVSGLLCNSAKEAQRQFGLRHPHTDQIEALTRALMEANPELRIMLLPHVHQPVEAPESDLAAARNLKARLGESASSRVHIVEQPYNAMELKWIISNLDWFAGARMHATIGAFSSGVPTLALGYTDKAYGVFEQCGIGDEVADLRKLDQEALASVAKASFSNRRITKSKLESSLDDLKKRASLEMDAIASQAGLLVS